MVLSRLFTRIQIPAEQLVKDGVINLLAFGPALIENGEIAVRKETKKLDEAMASDPRTANGIIGENHYII